MNFKKVLDDIKAVEEEEAHKVKVLGAELGCEYDHQELQRVWLALNIHKYNGKSAAANVTEIMKENARLTAQVRTLAERLLVDHSCATRAGSVGECDTCMLIASVKEKA